MQQSLQSPMPEDVQRIIADTMRLIAAATVPDPRPGVSKTLMQGSVPWGMMEPFPVQSPRDRKQGDAALVALEKFLRNFDPCAIDENRRMPDNYRALIRDSGMLRLRQSPESGGYGLSEYNFLRALHLAGSWCSPIALSLTVHNLLGMPAFAPYIKDEPTRTAILKRIADGAISALAATEEQGASNVIYKTTAVESDDGREYVINGTKTFIGNTPIAELLVVPTTTMEPDGKGGTQVGVTVFAVDANTPGVSTPSAQSYMGLKGIPNGLVRFDNVRVPATRMIGDRGNGLNVVMDIVPAGKLFTTAMCLAVMKLCLGWIRGFQDRTYMGMPLSTFALTQSLNARIAADIHAVQCLADYTALARDAQTADTNTELALCKAYAAEIAWRAIDDTMQLVAGQGYEDETSLKRRGLSARPVERFFRDIRVHRIFGTTNELMKLTIAQQSLIAASKAVTPAAPAPQASAAPGADNASPPLAAHSANLEQLVASSVRAQQQLLAQAGSLMALLPRQNTMMRIADIVADLSLMTFTLAGARDAAERGDNDAATRSLLAAYFCTQAERRVTQNIARLAEDDSAAIAAINTALKGDGMAFLQTGLLTPTQSAVASV